jgi:hypothetical protein
MKKKNPEQSKQETVIRLMESQHHLIKQRIRFHGSGQNIKQNNVLSSNEIEMHNSLKWNNSMSVKPRRSSKFKT